MGNDDISFGRETVIHLADAAEVDVIEKNALVVLGRDGSVLVQLQIDSPEDLRQWGEDLRSGIKVASRAAPDPGGKGSPTGRQVGAASGPDTEDTDGEVHLLQARSRQLQTQIGQLEAANERRDQQLQKMISRLDGAMQMLVAVQDMCGQQRRVIVAQKVAIEELTREVGGEGEGQSVYDEAARGGEAPGKKDQDTSRAPAAASATTGGEPDADNEEEMAAKSEKMFALLQRAELLQQALGELGAEAGDSEQAATAPPRRAAAPAQKDRAAPARADAPSPDSPDPPDTEKAAEEAAERLESLEVEKLRFEGMLRDSQAEHDDLLQRLTDMRSLMSMLGVQPEDLDADASEESSEGGDKGAAACIPAKASL